jgi:hypothetical protein
VERCLKKLTVAQLFEKFSDILCNPSSPLDTILGQINPLHTFTSYLFKICFNIIIPFSLRLGISSNPLIINSLS